MTRRPPMRRPLVALAAAIAAPALAQMSEPAPPTAARTQAEAPAPDLADGVRRALDAPYLTPDEARALRVFHGVWSPEDLRAGDALQAQAALIAGAYDAEVLRSPAAPPLDRAEAMVHAGELRDAAAMIVAMDDPGVRGWRIAAEAYELLGDFERADAAVSPIVERLMAREADAAELAEGVRALQVRARLRGQTRDEYQGMVALLARAYQEVDRLHWPALLAEAELLMEKDNPAEARDAAMQALSMCPGSAGVTRLLGQMSVATFDFTRAEMVATRLDDLAEDAGGMRPSLMGAVLRARAWVRQNQPDEAEAALDDLRGRYAANRLVMALRAAIDALRYDEAAVAEALTAFQRASPGSPLAEHVVGAALAEARQYAPAAAHLDAAHRMQGNWSAPLIELGLLEMQAGRDMLARPYLRRANELDPFNVRVRNSLKLIEELSGWDVVESEHFRVRYEPGVLGVMAREMLPELEKMHADLSQIHEHEPAFKTLIELLPDNEWFAVRITGTPELFTIAAATGPVVAMEAPREGPRSKVGVYDWVRVIRHEYTHTITLSKTANRLSHWFTEAAAVEAENAPRDYRRCQLLAGALFNDGLFTLDEINLKFVRPEKPTDRAQAYAQGHWMYRFMVERFGPEAPLNLMARYREGDRERAAFTAALGLTPEAFFDQFVQWAREDVVAWGMAPRPSLDQLRLQETLIDEDLRDAAADELMRFAARAGEAAAGAAAPAAYEVPLVSVDEDLLAFWSALHPDHPDLLEMQIEDALEAREGAADESMVPLLEAYAAARPVDPSPHQTLAKLYLESSEPSRAIPHLRYLDAREVYSPIYSVELAKRLAAIGRFAEALDSATRATQIAPFDADYRELAATIAIQAGRLAEGERHIAALVEIEPDRPIHRRRLEAIQQKRAAG